MALAFSGTLSLRGWAAPPVLARSVRLSWRTAGDLEVKWVSGSTSRICCGRRFCENDRDLPARAFGSSRGDPGLSAPRVHAP